ncbi:hypothetical protein GCM10022246_01540 [Pedobacter ginsengiterrae]|uniref:RadC-like JAB domain-containing protein n=2 Tax=Pedobacter ginsengiterrae TaxID=871696 RepID=A0ABP7NP80_9SPHI
MNDPKLEQFFLVGGTALSLKIGHRISIDIDLFTLENFDPNLLQDHILWNYGSNLKVIGTGALMGLIDGVKVDFITHPYPHVQPLDNLENIRMASLQDIAAMKLNAVVGSGERIKDFVDLYYLLCAHEADVKLTTRMVECGKLLGVEVHDHIILSAYGYYSFMDEGMI